MRTILAVEDSEDILELMDMTLTQRGYQVLRASSSEEAWQLWTEHADTIDILIADVNLGDSGSGLDLAEQLIQLKPSLRALAVTGYLQYEGQSASDGRIEFLIKPFHWNVLSDRIEQFFDSPAPSPSSSSSSSPATASSA